MSSSNIGPLGLPFPGASGNPVMDEAEVDAAIVRLELDMHDLQHRHRDLFSYANAWAERYDAIMAVTPHGRREVVENRLHRIGVRWGVATGPRMTMQFPALKNPV